jgi:hypothetical protein
LRRVLGTAMTGLEIRGGGKEEDEAMEEEANGGGEPQENKSIIDAFC